MRQGGLLTSCKTNFYNCICRKEVSLQDCIFLFTDREAIMLGDAWVPTNYVKQPLPLSFYEGRHVSIPVMPRMPCLLTQRQLVASLKNKQ